MEGSAPYDDYSLVAHQGSTTIFVMVMPSPWMMKAVSDQPSVVAPVTQSIIFCVKTVSTCVLSPAQSVRSASVMGLLQLQSLSCIYPVVPASL